MTIKEMKTMSKTKKKTMSTNYVESFRTFLSNPNLKRAKKIWFIFKLILKTPQNVLC